MLNVLNMLHMPISDIIKKISDGAKIDEAKIKDLIKSKIDSHDGLVSEEGAAYIVAHDLSVELFKVPTEEGGSKMNVKDLVVGMRNFELIGKVARVFPIREFQKQGKTSQVGNFNLTDESGTTRIVLWDQKANVIKENKLQQGQVIKLKNGNIKTSNFSPDGKEVHLTIRSQLILDAEETVNVEISEEYNNEKKEAISAKISEIHANQNIKTHGTVVRIYPPAFYDACPQCFKKVREGKCMEHNEVESSPAMVFSFILDDGTETVRCTGFRDIAEKLAGMTSKEAKEKSENPVLIQEEFDNKLLGSEIEIQGNVRDNKQFDRMEITVNSTNVNLDPVTLAKELTSK
jgi:ssDNA-binding replication factor A large subunit